MERIAWSCLALFLLAVPALGEGAPASTLERIRVRADGRGFTTTQGTPFVAFGVNYYRPGTGWAPQVWKQFDVEATRRDFVRLRELGGNCVRVFLTYSSFYNEAGQLDPGGLAKFDRFLELAEEAGLYVHPTGPDHWEGLPAWARTDRIADDRVLSALEEFWKGLAARYRGRAGIFAYDLLNEPEVGWDTPVMRPKWARWLEQTHGTTAALAKAWALTNVPARFADIGAPPAKDAPGHGPLLDYQRFRESLADEWTRRQAATIKAADPEALVTVGLIQWSVPVVLAHPRHYSAFRPERQARFLDFLEVHFYPLASGAYEYRSDLEEQKNLAYLDAVVREVARPGKPVVIAEFGWYGGGQPTFDGGKHPAATEEQQARWCRRLIETTRPVATGWLNWGFHDQPEARDVSQLTGLLSSDGRLKAWGREFQKLAQARKAPAAPRAAKPPLVALDWDACVSSAQARRECLDRYHAAFAKEKTIP